MNTRRFNILLALVIGFGALTLVQADPCGMVPPIFTGQSPITRIGLQKTYVFHKDGVETFVIRPGFQGKVDNFGMLIPFPNPPEIRKVADDVFDHIANAIDPPEVVVDLRIRRMMMRGNAAPGGSGGRDKPMEFAKDEVVVLKQEAIGMYEVAVLEAGSAVALKKWMDENGYKYPTGMDKVTGEYVDQGWCFVAVKTKVGQKSGVEARPGARKLTPELPAGSVFDGNVQGMGFRFPSKELVVPMRLSAFNEGDLRNVVYLLTDGPRKIRSIPEEYVVRQVSGEQLIKNVTQLLPLRVIGGTEKDIPEFQRRNLPQQRDPVPRNGVARDLFASDMLAVSTGNLSLRHEEEEKELLRIGEHFGLRGAEVDRVNQLALADGREKTTTQGLAMLKGMTLTVVDGDFPREVIARDNLSFAEFRMPQNRNNSKSYDANQFGPGIAREGLLQTGSIDIQPTPGRSNPEQRFLKWSLSTMAGLGLIGLMGAFVCRRPKVLLWAAILTGMAAAPAMGRSTAAGDVDDTLIDQLENSATATKAIQELRKAALESDASRTKIIAELLQVVKQDTSMSKRGWAIAAMAEIGGQDVDEYLLNVHADENQKMIVRTWAAAARVSMTRTVNGLVEKANLISQFPAIGRPIGMRIVEQLSQDSENVEPEKLLGVTITVPQLNSALAPMIMALGAEKLTPVMLHSGDQNVRRIAAGYLASLAQQGQAETVAKSVIDSVEFDADATEVPWRDGPLFIPGISWSKQDATNLVGSLIRWNLWCEIHGKTDEMRQIHNNIRSLALASAAGYQSPGWQETDASRWLVAWGQAVGKDGVARILKEQGVDRNEKYSGLLNQIQE